MLQIVASGKRCNNLIQHKNT